MESENFPIAPEGFHYRGQTPIALDGTDKNGKSYTKVSRLARYVPDEAKKTNKEKYEDMYFFYPGRFIRQAALHLHLLRERSHRDLC